MKQFTLKLRKILLCDYLYYLLLCICFIYIIIYCKNYEIDKEYDLNNTSFYLTIKDYLIDGNKLSITFNEKLVGTYYFETEKEKNNFKYNLNDKLFVKGTLSFPNNNTIPNTFNYKKYLYHKNINYILSIESYEYISSSENLFIKIKNYLYKKISSYNHYEYLYAFILGKSSYIDSDVYNNYKVNGITHLFALSGLHVSIFSSFILLILNKLKLNEKLSFVITSLFLILFSFIASFSASILRAVIFFILSNINKIWYFYIKPKYLLYITFIILEIINPFYIYNTGFILSFTITLSILLSNEKYKINNKILNILFISFISFLSSLPIIIGMNYEINIIGFINNLFFIPYVSYLIFPISLLNLIFPIMNNILFVLTNIMELISNYSTSIINITIYFSKLKLIEIILYYVFFILFLKRIKKIHLILFIFVIYLYLKPIFFKNNGIYFLDVNQGDSILIVSKNNETFLIDTGGKISNNNSKWKTKNNEFNLMNNSMIPYFKSIGLKSIDYLIITHGDYDHMGEAINLVNNFKVENVIFNCGEYNDLEKELIEVLEKKNINYYSCIKELNIDKYKLQFLNTGVYDNENDNSSVLYLNYNNYKFLFMGDASTIREKNILEKYNLSNIDFFKVGHHGSNTSSSEDFINSINPKYSLISVGKNNRYGHPKESVLDTLNNSNIYRTDLDGSIEIKLNKSGYKIGTCPP